MMLSPELAEHVRNCNMPFCKQMKEMIAGLRWIPETEYESTHEPPMGTVRWLPFIKTQGGWVADSEGKYPDLKLSEDA